MKAAPNIAKRSLDYQIVISRFSITKKENRNYVQKQNQSSESVFIACPDSVVLKSATAFSKVLLTCWHINIKSWQASFNTSLAESPAKFQAKRKNLAGERIQKVTMKII